MTGYRLRFLPLRRLGGRIPCSAEGIAARARNFSGRARHDAEPSTKHGNHACVPRGGGAGGPGARPDR
jgi:hypothetical protein